MTEKDEIRDAKSFLKEELRYLDLDGTAIPIADMIDRVLERNKKKRQFTTG